MWTEYNNTQTEFRENNKRALIRNMKIVDPDSSVNEEEIEQKLEAGDFTVLSSIIKESQQAKEDLKRLEDRHLEMVKLEQGIQEVRVMMTFLNSYLSPVNHFRLISYDVQVHAMFLEVSILVETQGEAVGRIEDVVGQAVHHVEEGRKQLAEAEKKKKCGRKLKFILAGIGAGVALVVLLLLLFAI